MPILATAAAGPPSAAWIPETSSLYLNVPVYGLATVAGVTVELALPADDGSEPAPGDWKTAAWTSTPYPAEPSADGAELLITAAEYPAALDMLWVRLTASPEQRVLQSGRVRTGAGD